MLHPVLNRRNGFYETRPLSVHPSNSGSGQQWEKSAVLWESQQSSWRVICRIETRISSGFRGYRSQEPEFRKNINRINWTFPRHSLWFPPVNGRTYSVPAPGQRGGKTGASSEIHGNFRRFPKDFRTNSGAFPKIFRTRPGPVPKHSRSRPQPGPETFRRRVGEYPKPQPDLHYRR